MLFDVHVSLVKFIRLRPVIATCTEKKVLQKFSYIYSDYTKHSIFRQTGALRYFLRENDSKFDRSRNRENEQLEISLSVRKEFPPI